MNIAMLLYAAIEELKKNGKQRKYNLYQSIP